VIGFVKFYDPRRGMGEITPEGKSTGVFVHVSEVERMGLASLIQGEKLRFDVRVDIALGRRFAVNLAQVPS